MSERRIGAEELRAAAERAVARAREAGVLEPIATQVLEIAEGGLRFAVHQRPEEHQRRIASDPAAPRTNPFLDPPAPLVVGAVSDTHLCLLNRYPVLANHLLFVTRVFAPQEAWLDPDDWAALAVGLAGIDGLGFYNAGPVAGASQPHKHLQLVPLPLGAGPEPVPIAPWLAAAAPGHEPQVLPGPPFGHAFVRIDPGVLALPAAEAGRALAALADRALAVLGVRPLPGPDGTPRQSAPYNLLVTRSWLLAVPRVCAEAHGVSVNALGFAGSFVVSGAAGLERLRAVGPLAVLRAVAGARSA